MGNDKENLFVYGTLLEPEVLKAVIGRVANGVEDKLKGYKKSQMEIDGEPYPILVAAEDEVVAGKVLHLTLEELAELDEYESEVYIRRQVVLESRIRAWVYIPKSDVRSRDSIKRS